MNDIGTFLKILRCIAYLGRNITDTIVISVMAMAIILAEEIFAIISLNVPNTVSCGSNTRPRALPIWPINISTPMPEVNPETNGNGIYSTTDPNLISPNIIWNNPERKPVRSKPSNPYLWTDDIISTTIAPVGP